MEVLCRVCEIVLSNDGDGFTEGFVVIHIDTKVFISTLNKIIIKTC